MINFYSLQPKKENLKNRSFQANTLILLKNFMNKYNICLITCSFLQNLYTFIHSKAQGQLIRRLFLLPQVKMYEEYLCSNSNILDYCSHA